jgi:hypothetical protein
MNKLGFDGLLAIFHWSTMHFFLLFLFSLTMIFDVTNGQLTPLFYQILLNTPELIYVVLNYGEGEGVVIVKVFGMIMLTLYSFTVVYFENFAKQFKINPETGMISKILIVKLA